SVAANVCRAFRRYPGGGRPAVGGQPPDTHCRLRLGDAVLLPPWRPPHLPARRWRLRALRFRLRLGSWILDTAAPAALMGALLCRAHPLDPGLGHGGTGWRRPPLRALPRFHCAGSSAHASARSFGGALVRSPPYLLLAGRSGDVRFRGGEKPALTGAFDIPAAPAPQAARKPGYMVVPRRADPGWIVHP